MREVPTYHPKFFRVAAPKQPAFKADDLYRLMPFNQKQMYSFDEILARLVDGSEQMEFRPDSGPEVYTGLVKLDGFLVGCIGNRQGWLGEGYPEYADYPGIGDKLYRQGLIKMNEFVTLLISKPERDRCQGRVCKDGLIGAGNNRLTSLMQLWG